MNSTEYVLEVRIIDNDKPVPLATVAQWMFAAAPPTNVIIRTVTQEFDNAKHSERSRKRVWYQPPVCLAVVDFHDLESDPAVLEQRLRDYYDSLRAVVMMHAESGCLLLEIVPIRTAGTRLLQVEF